MAGQEEGKPRRRVEAGWEVGFHREAGVGGVKDEEEEEKRKRKGKKKTEVVGLAWPK